MKLYTIKAIHNNEEYFLTSEYRVDNHFLERDLNFEKTNDIDNIVNSLFTTQNKEELTKLLNLLKESKNKDKTENFTIELHDFENYYSYFDSFEIKEITL